MLLTGSISIQLFPNLTRWASDFEKSVILENFEERSWEKTDIEDCISFDFHLIFR